MLIEVKNRFTNSVLFSHDVEENTLKISLLAALKAGADLYGADLRGAYLRGADLYGANLDGEKISQNPISIVGLNWTVLISDGFMRIGCQRHSHQEWSDFDDAQISNMASEALKFWRQWKQPLLAMCSAHAGKIVSKEVG